MAASRLGYRMNEAFATHFFARIFQHPNAVFPPEMLAPELQSLDTFAESMDVIVTTHQWVAQAYFDDGTVELAIPPLRALLEIMAFGEDRPTASRWRTTRSGRSSPARRCWPATGTPSASPPSRPPT